VTAAAGGGPQGRRRTDRRVRAGDSGHPAAVRRRVVGLRLGGPPDTGGWAYPSGTAARSDGGERGSVPPPLVLARLLPAPAAGSHAVVGSRCLGSSRAARAFDAGPVTWPSTSGNARRLRLQSPSRRPDPALPRCTPGRRRWAAGPTRSRSAPAATPAWTGPALNLNGDLVPTSGGLRLLQRGRASSSAARRGSGRIRHSPRQGLRNSCGKPKGGGRVGALPVGDTRMVTSVDRRVFHTLSECIAGRRRK